MISFAGKRIGGSLFAVFQAVILVISLCAPLSAEDQEIGMRAYVDKRSIYIGDGIRFSVEIRPEKGELITPPEFKDSRIGDFEIRRVASGSKRGLFGPKTLVYHYDITTYKVGKLTIPTVSFRYRKKPGAESLEAKTKPIDIVVKSILPEGGQITDIRDIKGPIGFRETNWFLILGIVIIVLAVVIFIIYLRRRSRKLPKTPYEQALDALNNINGLFSASGNVKEFYVRISDCVRRYIEDVFHLKAPEMTTQEFLSSVEGSMALSSDHKGLLRLFLNACDMVKFANYAPETNEIDEISSSARNFIGETKDYAHVHI